MELDFTILTLLNEKGVLSQCDVYYFYYDVLRLNEMRIECVDWEKDIVSIIEKYNAKIKYVETLPEAEPSSNEVYFVVSSSESIVVSLLRHIRNAFSHYRIRRIGEEFYINDRDKMKGRIDEKFLKKITETIWDIINSSK